MEKNSKKRICNILKICKSDFEVTIGVKNNFLTHNVFHCNFVFEIKILTNGKQ